MKLFLSCASLLIVCVVRVLNMENCIVPPVHKITGVFRHKMTSQYSHTMSACTHSRSSVSEHGPRKEFTEFRTRDATPCVSKLPRRMLSRNCGHVLANSNWQSLFSCPAKHNLHQSLNEAVLREMIAGVDIINLRSQRRQPQCFASHEGSGASPAHR